MRKSICNFVLVMAFTSSAVAQGNRGIYIHDGLTSVPEFTNLLNTRLGLSLVDFVSTQFGLQDLNSLVINEDSFQLQADIERIQSLPMREIEAEALIGVAERISEPNLTTNDIERVLAILSLYPSLRQSHFALWSKLNSQWREPIKNYASQEILELQSQVVELDTAIFIDGIKGDSNNIHGISKLSHQWMFISNQFYPIIVVGSLSQFQQALKAKQSFPLVCGEQITPWPEVPEIKLRELKKSDSCTPESSQQNSNGESLSHQPQNLSTSENKKSSWKSEWIVPLTLIAGAVTASELQNKQVSFHWPVYRF